MAKKKIKPDAAPREIGSDEMEGVVGGGSRQELLAHEVTHVETQAQFNPKEISIDKSVPWQRKS